MAFPYFLDAKKKRKTVDYKLITATNSLRQVLVIKQVICHPLSFLCSSVFPYLCSFFSSHHLVTCSFFNHFTLASLTKFTLFFSPTSRLFIQHISKFCYFFLFLSLKAATSSLFLKPKNLILTSLSTATCSLLLKMYSVVKPRKLANKVPVFHSR